MKIKLKDRLILYFGAFVALFSGAAMFVAGVQQPGVLASDVPGWVRAVCIVCGIFAMALGYYLILYTSRYNKKRRQFVVQRTDSGELRIAVKAIENLVQKCIDLHEEIQVSSMKILNSREGVVVDLSVTLDNNISIPLAVASLQKQIKQYLVASSGIEVKEVRVSVESAQDSAPAETLSPAEEEEQPAEKPAAAKEKKAPLHQRLFGRADEPAIVPEPPKEEEEAAPAEEEETAPVEEEEETAPEEQAAIPEEEPEQEEPEQEMPLQEEPEQEPETLPEETPAEEPDAETVFEAASIPVEEPEADEPVILKEEQEEPAAEEAPEQETQSAPESEEESNE